MALAFAVLMTACATAPPRTSSEREADKKLELAVSQQLVPGVISVQNQIEMHISGRGGNNL